MHSLGNWLRAACSLQHLTAHRGWWCLHQGLSALLAFAERLPGPGAGLGSQPPAPTWSSVPENCLMLLGPSMAPPASTELSQCRKGGRRAPLGWSKARHLLRRSPGRGLLPPPSWKEPHGHGPSPSVYQGPAAITLIPVSCVERCGGSRGQCSTAHGGLVGTHPPREENP